MADISKINGVEVANISKVDNVETGNVDTILSGEVPAQQANAALTSLTNEDYNASRAYGVASAYNPTDKVMIFQYGDQGNNAYATVVCATASASAGPTSPSLLIYTALNAVTDSPDAIETTTPVALWSADGAVSPNIN